MTSSKEGNGGGEGSARSGFGVDYVIHYKVPENERAEAEAAYVQLIEALTSVGLATEVRPADDSSLFVFVKLASEGDLRQQVFHARLQDWLHGVRTTGTNTNKEPAAALMEEPVSEAERLRLVYLAIVRTKEEGGAGITPGAGRWKYVDSAFPLHDRQFNGEWIKRLSTRYLLARSDLDEIRNKFGEGVALYFAFIQSYFRALVFPAALGAGTWLLFGGGQFSVIYALGSCLWCVVFFEYWKTKEVDLAVQWGVRGVSKIQMPRVEFVSDRVAEDPVTGEKKGVYSPFKRFGTQLLQAPFTVACVLVLGGFIAMCNSLEVFINEVYTGPFKMFLAFLPTILQVVSLPAFSKVLTGFAKKLTDMENYETVDAHQAAMVQKEFVLNFITSYMPLAFTAFVYLPFGQVLMPYLDFWRVAAETVTFGQKKISMQEFQIDPARITKQMFYFTVTAQVVNFGTEAVVPYLKRKLTNKAKERGIVGKAAKSIKDAEEEASFLEKVRAETELEVYDVTTDYREMVIQFGYLSLFSVAWPLAGCSFLVNNWVELRSDAFKIATASRRPIPWRADSIGPWLNALGFLSWLGSLTSAAVVYLCRGETKGSSGAASNVQAWGLLLAVLLAEHFYLAVQMGVRTVMERIDSPGLQRERRERYAVRMRMLGEGVGEKLAQSGLHGEAGSGDQKTPDGSSDRFWRRHKGAAGTIEAGRKLISRVEE